MAEFKYNLGDIVILDPAGNGNGAVLAKVIGRTEFLDGALHYMVSAMGKSDGHSAVVRHTVAEYELREPASYERG